jgi:NADH-quinone oxidoreductase subunit G
VLENDLFRRAESEQVAAFLNAARHVVVLDCLKNPTTARAELVLPAGTFAETDGTLVNYEGRAQRFFQAFVPSGEVRASWRWLGDGLVADAPPGEKRKWKTLDEIVRAIVNEMPVLAGIEHAAPSRDEFGKVAREPNRYSGRTSMLANISVHEPKPAEDRDSALAFSMESGPQAPPPPLIPFFWAPGWNSIQSVNKFQGEISGPLRGGDPGIRLIDPPPQTTWDYFSEVPAVFRADAEGWLLVPCFHIFGSEELSRLAPGIAELMPRAFIALNATDGLRMGIKPGELMKVSIGSSVYELELSLRPDVPRGVALIPAGIPPIDGIPLPARGKPVPAAAMVQGVSK